MMEDLSKFSPDRKKNVQDWFLTIGKPMGISRAVGSASDFSGVPCIVVCYWIAEVDGWSEDLLFSYKVIKDFYDYTEIRNAPEGSPK